jgi:hypothetical protein
VRSKKRTKSGVRRRMIVYDGNCPGPASETAGRRMEEAKEGWIQMDGDDERPEGEEGRRLIRNSGLAEQ